MIRNVAQVTVVIALLGLAGPGSAQEGRLEPRGHLGFVGEFDLEMGGDNVATVYFDDGSTQDVRAGQGGTLSIGAHYQPATASVDFVITGGFKFVTTKASNSSIGINRGVLEVLALYDPSQSLWIGGGPVLHFGTTFDAGGLGSDVSFAPSLGLTVQAGWSWAGVTYTYMKYQGGGGTFDASAFGMSFRWRS